MGGSIDFILIIALALVHVMVRGTPLDDTTQEWLKNSISKAPSLRVHVKLTDDNTKIHGQSTFDMFANPVVSDDRANFHYDGFSVFVEGDTNITYMVVNGISYMVENSARGNKPKEVRCLPSVIPFDQLLSALNNATAIPSASVGGNPIDCPSGSLFKTSLDSAEYVLCASRASGFTVYGLDVTITVEFLPSPVHKTLPALNDKSCPVVATPTQVTPTAISLLTGETLPPTRSRNLKKAFSIGEDESCECKSTPRPCIFLHGAGNPTEETELQDTPKLTKQKFGEIGDHAPCCTTVKYAVLNTVDYGWTSDTLQQKYCDFSLSMSESSDLSSHTVSDTIIVTHSMGGLVIAGALASGKCKFSDSTSWVSLSAPMKGTMAADYIQDLCDGDITGLKIDILDMLGLVECPASTSRMYLGYQNGKHTTSALNAAYTSAQKAYRENVDAAICSKTYHGVYSSYYLKSVIGGKMIPHKSKENDGLVEFDSCVGGLDPELFGDSYLDPFYAGELNHADTAFLTHDGVIKDAQKPFKWFECLL